MSTIPAHIANFVRQEVRVPRSKPLVPVFEAVSNSLDAITDGGGTGTVRVTVLRQPDELDGSRGLPHTFIVEDDGVGFTDENVGAFNLLFSERKLARGGKGRGRFTYLKVFEEVRVESTFTENGSISSRRFSFSPEYTAMDTRTTKGSGPRRTKIWLEKMRLPYAQTVPREATTLEKEFIIHFLPLLLSDNGTEIVIRDGNETHLAEFVREGLVIEQERDNFEIGTRSFSLLQAKLRPRPGLRHRLILAASAREVRGDNLEKFLPVLAAGPLEIAGEQDGFVLIAIVAGQFLDETVDPMRGTFIDEDDDSEMDEDAQHSEPLIAREDLFGEPTSIRHIRREALERVYNLLHPYLIAAIGDRSKAIEAYIRRDGMGYHFLKDAIPDLAKTLRTTDDQAIETSLHSAAYVERRRRTAEARRLLSASPKEKSEHTYFERWQEIVDRLSDVAKSDLANYVAHRRAILDLITDELRTSPDGSYRREEVLHNLVFPKGKQSGNISYEQQNLWLIDERLAFHEHLYSDISIRRITGSEVIPALRPDLAIFETGFAAFHDGAKPPTQLVIVELKRPGREDASRDEPVRATLQYVEHLKSGRARTEGGAVIDIEATALTTVYLLSDWTADFRRYLRREDFRPMPGDIGQYKFHETENIMFIAMSFDRVVEGARRRNSIFFKKLGIDQ
jgi:hypothetical protein